jgi:hypothetical protein
MEVAEAVTALAVNELLELFPRDRREGLRIRLRTAVLSAVISARAMTSRPRQRGRIEPSAN